MLGLGSIFAAWNIAKNSEIYDNHFIKSESKTDTDEEEEDLDKYGRIT